MSGFTLEGEVRHDMYGYYYCSLEEADFEDEGSPSVGFDGRAHFDTIEEAEAFGFEMDHQP